MSCSGVEKAGTVQVDVAKTAGAFMQPAYRLAKKMTCLNNLPRNRLFA